MYAVNNSARALFLAMIPLAVAHAVLGALALLGAKATQPGFFFSPDQALLLYAERMATDGALLFAGHYMLRHRAISSRLAYTLMGGCAAALGYAIAIHHSVLPSDGGTELTVGLLPVTAGMIAGFLYGQFAGLESVRHSHPPSVSDEKPVLSSAFDGPTRVRTSAAAILIAALMPAVLTTILAISLSSLLPGFTTAMSTESNAVIAAALPAQLFITILVTSVVPSAIFVLCMHHVTRALGRHRARTYATVGGAMAGICAYLLSPMIPLLSVSILVVVAVAYGAMMGALYRRFAGLEPVPLPEAVIATDPNALVGADHPARRQHRVILSS